MNELSPGYLDDVLSLPDGADRRDLEWCTSVATWTEAGPELRAINVAVAIAVGLLRERAANDARVATLDSELRGLRAVQLDTLAAVSDALRALNNADTNSAVVLLHRVLAVKERTP